jgi:hypothetical protein
MSSAQDRADYQAGEQEARATSGQAQSGQAQGTQTQAGAHRQTTSYAAGSPRAGYEGGTGRGMALTGSTVLAATLMMLAGLWGFFEGLVAILRQNFFVHTSNYTFQWSVHSWGWVHLILGVVLFAAGACVLLGQTWAKALGIVLAVFSGIASFLFLPYYPVWSIILVAIDVFIIWALATSMSRSEAA